MINSDYESKTIVLKKTIDELQIQEIVEKKKTSLFKKFLKKPKSEDVHVHSIKLNYEAILMVSGIYSANYFRKATHPIKVDFNVREVVLGEGIFPIKTKSKFNKAISGKKSKNKIELDLEEHVFIENEDKIYFDHHGKQIRFPFKINSKSVENYPKRILNRNPLDVKKPEITYDAAIELFTKKLMKPREEDVRDLKEEFRINEVSEIYVPVYEARLIGPKKKVAILRIDAVRKKVL